MSARRNAGGSGTSGTVVGTSDAQTLTNKTLDITLNTVTAGAGGQAGDIAVISAGGGHYNSVPLLFWGDGSDGSSVTSGPISESRNAYRLDWTPIAGCAVNTNGWREHVAGTLDATAIPAGAIYQTATPGNDASGVTGGAAVAVPTTDPIGTGSFNFSGVAATQAGRTGTTNAAGAAGNAAPAGQGVTHGGPAGVAGAGGAGNSGALAGGTAGANNAAPQRDVAMRTAALGIAASAQSFRGGEQAPTGGAGGGDSGGAGGGSGGAGIPGPMIGIFARYLLVSSSNPNAGVIVAKGSKGGNGGTPPAATVGRGGGAGAPGTGGGFVLVVVGGCSGGTHANAIDVTGGSGGDAGLGANGSGTATNGTPGGAGYGGSHCFINFSKTTPQTQITVVTKWLVGGLAGIGTVGGLATTAQIDLVAA